MLFQGEKRSFIAPLHALAAVVLVAVVWLSPAGAAGAEQGRESGFRWGFRERIRQSYLGNGFDLDSGNADDRNFLRFRSQLWGEWKPMEGLRIYLGLNNEHRHWLKSEKGLEDEDFEIDELVVENFYVAAGRIGGSPLSIVAGRQNIRYGEGFIMMDGGPLDGSRTAYFNAVKVRADWPGRSLEVHALSDPAWDHYMPVVNNLYSGLIEYDETGAGIYYTDDSFGWGRLETYYFYKSEQHEEDLFPQSDIHTFGARASGSLAGSTIPWAAEFALQGGDMGEASRRGHGGYAHAGWKPSVRMSPSLEAGIIVLSGDDPGTEEYEGWNPLYSRWPKWSDLLIYTFASTERGVAWWDNLVAPNLELALAPLEKLSLSASVFYMAARYSRPDAGPVHGDGRHRGLLTKLRLGWSYTEYISGHLLWEYFKPGDYYFDGADAAHFLRCEFMFSY